jgi:hypothetical protein
MTTKEIKRQMYADSRIKTKCNQDEWARLFNLGAQKGQQNVSTKESGVRSVNMPEAFASQLLMFIHQKGYDVKNIEFNEDGYIANISKRQ